MFRKMIRRFIALFVTICFIPTLVGIAEQYNTLEKGKIYEENMVNMEIKYVGKTQNAIGKLCNHPNITNIFSGIIPLYGFLDGMAYFPSNRFIYKIDADKFYSIELVGNDYDILGAYRVFNLNLSEESFINVSLAIERISGIIVEPNGTFSFMELCGPFTSENGYEKSFVIDNGSIYNDYGGNASIVSSVIYSAIMHNTNLEVIEVKPYNPETLVFPAGTDASVYNGNDLKFINHYEFSIQIELYTDIDSVLVLIEKC